MKKDTQKGLQSTTVSSRLVKEASSSTRDSRDGTFSTSEMRDSLLAVQPPPYLNPSPYGSLEYPFPPSALAPSSGDQGGEKKRRDQRRG